MTVKSRSVSRRVSEEVGSSKITTRASSETARAIATIWRSAIEIMPSGSDGSVETPSSESQSPASLFIRPKSISPKRLRGCRPMKMFSAIDRYGSRLTSWWTGMMPSLSACAGSWIDSCLPSRKISPSVGW